MTREPSYMWGGLPVYRCSVCGDRYERVSNLGAVLRHEDEAHPTTVRPSNILGSDGQPFQVEEKSA